MAFYNDEGLKRMSTAIGHIEILPDPQALAHHVAEWMTRAALSASGPFRVSLSGGSTPKMLYGLLASDDFRSRFPWPRVFWYWGDERFVPYDHPDSNYRMTRETMLAKAPVPPENIHPIPTDGTPDDAARRYERTLQDCYGAATLDPQRALFDVTLLGLGPDGHTASLLPGEPVLDERKRWVAGFTRPARGPHHHDVSGDREQPASRLPRGRRGKGRDFRRHTRRQQPRAGGARPAGRRIVLVCRSSGGRRRESNAAGIKMARRYQTIVTLASTTLGETPAAARQRCA